MIKPDSRRLLEALIQGCNPLTGELLPEESPYNSIEVVRALSEVLLAAQSFPVPAPKKTTEQKLEERRARNRAQGLPENYSLPWDPEDRAQVGDYFQQDESLQFIAEQFKRKPSSILSELAKQELITLEQREQCAEKLRRHPEEPIRQSLLTPPDGSDYGS